jgi:prepilin-type N-terminal cleavage/methylation domain-containing protein
MTNLRLRAFSKVDLNSNGFTIVELMISLAVLSVILVIGTVVMINIGDLYDKGVTTSDLQNTTRSIDADVTSALQFSGNQPIECNNPTGVTTNIANNCTAGTSNTSYTRNSQTVSVYAYCIGTTRYTYILNNELGTDATTGINTPYVLWRDTLKQAATSSCYPASNMANAETDPSSGNPSTGDPNTVTNSGYEMMGDHTSLTAFSIIADTSIGSGDVYDIQINSAFGNSGLLNNFGSSPNPTCNSQLSTTSSNFCSTSTTSSTVVGRLY